MIFFLPILFYDDIHFVVVAESQPCDAMAMAMVILGFSTVQSTEYRVH